MRTRLKQIAVWILVAPIAMFVFLWGSGEIYVQDNGPVYLGATMGAVFLVASMFAWRQLRRERRSR